MSEKLKEEGGWVVRVMSQGKLIECPYGWENFPDMSLQYLKDKAGKVWEYIKTNILSSRRESKNK